jgi:molybdopterin molybdotransferase
MHDAHKQFVDGILSNIRPQSSELVKIGQSFGRIVASDIITKQALPLKDTVCVNGYAIICSDSSNAPVNLEIIAKSSAGCPFEGKIENLQTVRTYAGSPLPIGADTIIPDDESDVEGGFVTVKKPFLNQQNILYSGTDFAIDEIIIKKGTKITAIEIAIAASMNMPSLEVFKTPRIGILAIGDELIDLGKNLDCNKTISTSGIILQSLIDSFGGIAIDLGILPDNEVLIRDKLKAISDIDLLVTTGGLSAASDGLLKKALCDDASKSVMLQLNLNDKAFVMMSYKNDMPILSLSGQTISAYMCATLFLQSVISHMSKSFSNSQEIFAILDRDLDVNDLKMDYILCSLALNEDKVLKVKPASSYDRMLISTLNHSDCMMKVDKNNSHKGDAVNIYKFRG